MPPKVILTWQKKKPHQESKLGLENILRPLKLSCDLRLV